MVRYDRYAGIFLLTDRFQNFNRDNNRKKPSFPSYQHGVLIKT